MSRPTVIPSALAFSIDCDLTDIFCTLTAVVSMLEAREPGEEESSAAFWLAGNARTKAKAIRESLENASLHRPTRHPSDLSRLIAEHSRIFETYIANGTPILSDIEMEPHFAAFDTATDALWGAPVETLDDARVKASYALSKSSTLDHLREHPGEREAFLLSIAGGAA